MKAYVLILLILVLMTGCTVGKDSKDIKIDRITLAKAPENCSDNLSVSIPVDFLEKSIIEQIEWYCVSGKDTLRYVAYHIYTYTQPHYSWCVLADPLEHLAYLESCKK